MTGNDVTWPEVTRSYPELTLFHQKWPSEGCRRSKTLVLGPFQLLQTCNLQVAAVTWLQMMSHDWK